MAKNTTKKKKKKERKRNNVQTSSRLASHGRLDEVSANVIDGRPIECEHRCSVLSSEPAKGGEWRTSTATFSLDRDTLSSTARHVQLCLSPLPSLALCLPLLPSSFFSPTLLAVLTAPLTPTAVRSLSLVNNLNFRFNCQGRRVAVSLEHS